MVIGKKIVPFISEFVDELDDAIAQQTSQKRLSKTQKYWLAICFMAILATKSVCWAKFEPRGKFSGCNFCSSWTIIFFDFDLFDQRQLFFCFGVGFRFSEGGSVFSSKLDGMILGLGFWPFSLAISSFNA